MHGERDDWLRPEFCESAHCHVGAHCCVCRDKEGGRRWRRLIARRFVVDGVDWPCPHGNPWGYQPPPKASVPAGTSQKRARRSVPHVEKELLGLPYVAAGHPGTATVRAVAGGTLAGRACRGSTASRTRARERRAICDACKVPALECEVRYKRELQAAGGKTCWFGRFIRRASSRCPAEPPKWLAVTEPSPRESTTPEAAAPV